MFKFFAAWLYLGYHLGEILLIFMDWAKVWDKKEMLFNCFISMYLLLGLPLLWLIHYSLMQY